MFKFVFVFIKSVVVRRLFKIQKKIYTAVLVLHCFMSTQWQFVNQKIQSIMAEVQAEDEDGFSCNFEVDQNTFFKNSAIGGKIYLLKDDLKDLDKHKKRLFQYEYRKKNEND